MNVLPSAEPTFSLAELFKIVCGVFSEKIQSYEFPANPNKPDLYNFYESEISDPIDSLKDVENNLENIDFIESVLIMSWVFYQAWSGSVVDQGMSVSCLDNLDQDAITKNFLSNLDCEEGQEILRKIKK